MSHSSSSINRSPSLASFRSPSPSSSSFPFPSIPPSSYPHNNNIVNVARRSTMSNHIIIIWEYIRPVVSSYHVLKYPTEGLPQSIVAALEIIHPEIIHIGTLLEHNVYPLDHEELVLNWVKWCAPLCAQQTWGPSMIEALEVYPEVHPNIVGHTLIFISPTDNSERNHSIPTPASFWTTTSSPYAPISEIYEPLIATSIWHAEAGPNERQTLDG
ncbi:hypothetical protein CVT24_012176 [Panaeolus cyanescens]|uniref:Uncharacterized protein n=1 Tax=Panaeolus cyanescens TaxID=181874 RepID=A0A409YIR9_9AGAR|nr:hypothetical protein CVT24_012176 [Panaeolus cyanescens]